MQDIAPEEENICAVIVTFNPAPDIIKEIKALVPQVNALVVIDNGSENASLIKQATKIGNNIILIENKENLGQGRALNQGVQWAIKHHYEWTLLMDHDSLPKEDMVANQIIAYHEALAQGIHAVLVGVNATNKKIQKRLLEQCKEEKFFVPRGGIQTSGSLLSLQTYQQLGSFREDFFIDYIDTEYCLRLKVKKLRSIIACQADMLHELGKEGKSRDTANYPPWRRYYRTRNEVVLIKKYLLKQPLWVIHHLKWSLCTEWRLILWTEDQRTQKIKSALKGIKDGLLGKMGKKTFES